MIKKYWNWKRGTLVGEYEMVKKDKKQRKQFRWLDAVIILDGDHEEITSEEFEERGLTDNDEVGADSGEKPSLSGWALWDNPFFRGL